MGKKLLSLLMALSLALGCMAPTAFAAEPETPDESITAVEDTAAGEDEAVSAEEESPAADEEEQTVDTEAPAGGEAELLADPATYKGIWGGVAWSLTEAGTLTISAVPGAENPGVMPNSMTRPWTEHLENGVSLLNLIIEEGVTHIGDYNFMEYPLLRAVAFPESLTSIGRDAFERCTALCSLTFPSRLESIGREAFLDCENLTGDVTIPGSCKTVGSYAFQNTSITGLNLEEGVEEIRSNAFQSCTKLTSVVLPSTIKSVGELAFGYCGAETVVIDSTKGAVFENMVFSGCKSLTEVTIKPDSVIDIPDLMFLSCEKLVNVSLPEGIRSIGRNAFSNCSVLTGIKLPDSLETLGDFVFESCQALQSITIPNKVQEVGSGTFQFCSSLTAVVLGEGVQTVGVNAFLSCEKLKSLTLYYNLRTVEGNAFNGVLPLDVTFYGTQAEWETLFNGVANNNNALTEATPKIIPIIHSTLTWDNKTINSVAEAATEQVPLDLRVERPAEIKDETTTVTALAAAYDTAGRMLGIFSCEVEKNGSTLHINKLPANAFSIQIMMVDDSTAPLLPAKSIT